MFEANNLSLENKFSKENSVFHPVEIVFFRIPNFLETSLFAIPFSFSYVFPLSIYLLASFSRQISFSKFFFLYVFFFSRTFTNHRTTVEEGEYFFNSSLPLPPA